MCPTDYPDGRGELWWLALEEIVSRANEIELCRNGELWQLPTATLAEKERAFEEIYWWLRGLDEATQRSVVRVLADRYEVDMRGHDPRPDHELGRDPGLGRRSARHHRRPHQRPLCHRQALARESEGGDGGKRRQAREELGVRPAHFSFPYGDVSSARARDFALARELGFKTAVTTRKGMLFPAHRRYPTALPRVSLNGEYQSLTYTALYLSGAPFALVNRFQQVDAA